MPCAGCWSCPWSLVIGHWCFAIVVSNLPLHWPLSFGHSALGILKSSLSFHRLDVLRDERPLHAGIGGGVASYLRAIEVRQHLARAHHFVLGDDGGEQRFLIGRLSLEMRVEQ